MSVDTSRARLDADLLINGVWVEGKAGHLDNVDPGTGQQIGHVSLATGDQVNEAITAAESAFASWSTLLPTRRGDILKRAADLLAERAEEAVATILLETGKTEADARGEIGRSVDTLRWNGEQAGRIQATTYPGIAAGSRRQSRPTPLGPVAVVTAWNFPAVLATRKLGAALAAGCTVVFKASEFAPATARLIVELLLEAGLPAGVVNLIFGDPAAVSAQLTASPAIKALSFTGSTAVGKALAAQAAPQLIRTVLELGGHAPVIVMDDADVDHVIATTAGAKFGSAGQSCVAPSRYFVHETLYAQFVEKLTAKARSYVLGHGIQDGVTLGAVAHQGRVDALLQLVQDAQDHGATITTGGQQEPRDGFYFQPTIVAGLPLTSHAAILSEEPFGPIATVSSFTTPAEAVEAANAAPYSFAAYVFTDSLQTRDELVAGLNASNIGINQLAPSLPDVPLGGLGNSGYGYEGGTEGILAFCQLRLVSESAGRP
ncbi:Succinate-semialdehyde dehydrogenase [Nostocoides japonicum T1-X7]|uniref:Succinate-semialdehyde dehydrogenase n=1 Tax=Nostocoides japonicum T1-X7 TaxID=1194083 RepID=A0A077M4X0_9MICO|nr:aldehyde dehydrogenase family protein [Tetrasphaera japonica]CCH79149.1 Succinate-semialdehyde dehydrogenase [Tetrasphaera japonica T1-X7]